MTLFVQDSTGVVAGANGYISVVFFKDYHDARGNDYSAAADDAAIEFAIIKATDYLDQRFRYIGEKLRGRDQVTEWPRMNAWDCSRYYINGIPYEVENATAEYALRAISASLNPDPTRDSTGQTVQSFVEEVGPLKEAKKFVSGATFSMPKYPVADQILIKTGLIATSGNVSRG